MRLPHYDYSTMGAYFVTICTADKQCLFGRVENGIMLLNDHGKTAEHFLRMLPERYAGIILDEHVVMPNHVHAIIMITSNDDEAGKTPVREAPVGAAPVGTAHLGAAPVGAAHEPPVTPVTPVTPVSPVTPVTPESPIAPAGDNREGHDPPLRLQTYSQQQQRKPPSLPLILGFYKMNSAKEINHYRQTPGSAVWQRNYYDRIIRNDTELEEIQTYIANNPSQWEYNKDNC